MEKFVDELSARLITKFSREDVIVIKEIIYSTLKDYDIVPKTYELMTMDYVNPRELKIYLVSRQIDGLSDKSLDNYRKELQKMLGFINKAVKDIKTEDIRLYLYDLKSRGKVSDSTLNTRRSYISAFFTWLNNNNYLDSNPTASISPIKFEKKIKKALTDIEMEKLRVVCKNNYERAVLEVLYSTACRVSELVNIKFEDIDYEKKEVSVIRGKGKKSRITCLNARAIVAIREYVKNRDYPTVYLFEASRKPHNQLSARSIEKVCESLKERSGIIIYPHKVRRTTATNLWKKGMSLEKIKDLLGHEDLSTTSIYVDIDKDSVKSDYQKYM